MSLVQMPCDCMALIVSFLGVAWSLMLVQAAAAVTSVHDVTALRAMYHSAARVFVMPRRLRRAVAATAACSPGPCVAFAFQPGARFHCATLLSTSVQPHMPFGLPRICSRIGCGLLAAGFLVPNPVTLAGHGCVAATPP